MADEAHAEIVFYRPPAVWRDRARSYRLMIDGQICGKIRSGRELGVHVDPGRHVVQALISWTGSSELTLDVQSGQSIKLRVEPAGNASHAFGQALTQTDYLRVSIDDGNTLN